MGLEHDLEVYLKENGYLGSTPVFKKFIESKTSITKVEGTEKYKYEFKTAGENPVHQTIRDFLKQPQHKKFIDKFERNKKAESCYKRTIYNKIDQKIPEKKRGDKICRIFYIILDEKLPTTSVIKQCEKRYQQLINKVTFDLEQVELINIGIFFFTIIYYLAKQEKDKTKSSVEKKKPEELSTKSEKLDSILDNASSRSWPIYYGKDAPYDFCARNYLETYFADKSKFDKELPTKEDQERLYNWVINHKEEIKNLRCFDSNLQEGEHKFLYTLSDSSNYDNFAECIFYPHVSIPINGLTAYFFKGSHKEELILNGHKTGIFGYTGGKLDYDSFGKYYELKYLEENLKPIWFRDITKKNKKYTKTSLKQLRKTASSYAQYTNSSWGDLLSHKTIKYIQLTYQCKEDSILVSFKTNHFEKPHKVLNEEEFKALYRKNPNRALYRGLRSEKHGDDRGIDIILQKMREKGIAYNVRHHNQQYFGPGIYWSKELNKEGGFGNLTVMGIGTADLPDPPDLNALSDHGRRYQNMFLQRDNTSVILRHKAMYNNTEDLLSDKEKEKLKELDVVVCDTEKEMDDWAKCK